MYYLVAEEDTVSEFILYSQVVCGPQQMISSTVIHSSRNVIMRLTSSITLSQPRGF
jgi:hypothetical protein